MSTHAPPLALVLCALACALALAGCGIGIGPGAVPKKVQLTVTHDFGAQTLQPDGPLRVVGQETVMSLLMRNYSVTTRYGGGFVQSIDGLSGGVEGGKPVDWFYYVNGIEAPKGAAATNVYPGDRIWWDLHDWSETESIPAVVGSFPEPFLNGIDDKRPPVRVECASVGYACNTIESRLLALGVPASIAATGGGGAPETLRVVVGPWSKVGGAPGAQVIERGPRSSGVFARFSSSGAALTLLEENGNAVKTLGPGAGLIAATRGNEEEDPVWIVTGTDEAGVDRAARSFDESALRDHFAVALSSTGAIALPEGAG